MSRIRWKIHSAQSSFPPSSEPTVLGHLSRARSLPRRARDLGRRAALHCPYGLVCCVNATRASVEMKFRKYREPGEAFDDIQKAQVKIAVWFLVFLVPTLSFSGIVAHRMNRYVDPAAPCERERAKPR